jgi:Na(+)-translocating NADH:ubiquinone oxidoreductase A subunit
LKFHGGYTPKIAGRPASGVEKLELPGVLNVSRLRHGTWYAAVVRDGRLVRCGDALAEASTASGALTLPSPATGIVRVTARNGNDPARLAIEVTDAGVRPDNPDTFEPMRLAADAMRARLAKGGVWPFFWSSRSRGMPAISGEAPPRSIVVNCILTEPFRARGKVVLRQKWDQIIEGIRFLPRLMQDYGRVEIVLTDERDPVAQAMHRLLAGDAWVRFHAMPLAYPTENPRILAGALRRFDRAVSKDDSLWTIDIQGVAALGAWLGEGIPLHSRIVALGGPAHPSPKHLCVRIGTPVKSFMREIPAPERVEILRGGLLNGTPVDPETDTVQYDDDAFFFLPKAAEREFLAFLRPGFDRTSFSPCFASRITGAYDTHISTSLRGEHRPCISCGRCEEVCPARLMPQILHRLLYREAIDEAQAAGLPACVECGLCTYVCPSKIDMQKQFADAKAEILREQSESEAKAQ